MSLIQGGSHKVNTTAFYPKTIDQSLRFEDGDSAYLTLASGDKGTPTNVDKCTISVWLKRGEFGRGQTFMFAGTLTNNTILQFDTSDTIYFSQESGGSKVSRVYTSAVFRDTSAWYHIVFAYDSTEAVAADRAKLWVNGVSVEFTTVPNALDLNRDNFWFSDSHDSYIGNDINLSTHKFSGYMAEYYGVDGQALDHTSFGEFKSGIWIPKEYTGTYGTNGFKLTFEDSAAIGDDTSGNGNDWTVNNLVASDVVPDSPTNNFATLSPLARTVIGSTSILAEGNLSHQSNASEYRSGASTFLIPTNSGKWYWEVYARSGGIRAGVIEGNPLRLFYSAGYYIGYHANEYSKFAQYKVNNASFSTLWGTSATVGDVVGFLFDSDNGDLYTYLNGTIEESGTAMFSGLTSSEGYIPAVSDYNSITMVNFGQDSTFAGNLTAGGNSDANGIGDFKYTVPTDAKALCTANLPDPVIDPAQDATPEDHFNVALWTGNGSTQSIDVGHASDFVWIKTRNAVVDHRNYDSVRGVNTALRSNTTSTEAVETTSLTSFDSTGFSLGNAAANNNSGSTYVGWSWKAGGTGVANTDGTITSTVSANTDAGFSIVGYTGNATAGATVGHGLSSTPEMIIVKERTNDGGWWSVYHKDSTATGTAADTYLQLNATATSASWNGWNDTPPTASVFSLGSYDDVNGPSDTYIAYCFHSVDGFSKCGSYIGNGSADGPFVYTGHRSRFLLVKRTNGAASSWYIWDTERDPDNPAGLLLLPNSSGAEIDYTSTYPFDLLSNGFKVRATAAAFNNSGNTYVFYSAAEQPFKYSNAR